MADAKKDEKEKNPPVKETKPTEAATKPDSEKGQVKISRMSLAEVEKAIEQTQKQMGGLTSHYARTLLAQKAFLSSQKPVSGKR